MPKTTKLSSSLTQSPWINSYSFLNAEWLNECNPLKYLFNSFSLFCETCSLVIYIVPSSTWRSQDHTLSKLPSTTKAKLCPTSFRVQKFQLSAPSLSNVIFKPLSRGLELDTNSTFLKFLAV